MSPQPQRTACLQFQGNLTSPGKRILPDPDEIMKELSNRAFKRRGALLHRKRLVKGSPQELMMSSSHSGSNQEVAPALLIWTDSEKMDAGKSPVSRD